MKLSLFAIAILFCLTAGAQTSSTKQIFTAKVGTLGKGYVTAKQLCDNPVINLDQKGYIVLSCTFSYIKNGQDDMMGPYTITGGTLKKGDACLFDLNAGDRVFIDDIKVGCADCSGDMKATPLAFTIVKQ